MIGHVFAARVSGVARFGLFVRVAESGTDGLVPLSNLPIGAYRLDAGGQRLTSRHARRSFGLGDAVSVRLVEADPIGARLVFRLEDDTPAPARPQRGVRRGRTPRRR
jgi:ribonuclease R